MTSRRQFLLSSAATGLISATGLYPSIALANDKQTKKAEKPLKILFLGGTGFLGPHTVNYALERGHEITLFNRGRSKEELFPNLESIKGNRDPDIDDGLSALEGREWDCVIDTSGYVPRIVDASSKLLAKNSKHYLFISSISVYSEFTKVGLDETGAVGTLEDPTIESITGGSYGPLKAYCEQAAEKNFPGRTTVIRPGLIVGPRDRTDRYTYWPVRTSKGGKVLAPGDGKDFVQYIDVRDLGAFIIHCLEEGHMGIYNATSPMHAETTKDMLESCKKGTGSDATFVWADSEFLAKHEVQPWSGMPVWVPRQGELGGLSQVDVSKAEKAGLKFTERKKTVLDTLDWFSKQPAARQKSLRAGIPADKESEVLKAWLESQNS